MHVLYLFAHERNHCCSVSQSCPTLQLHRPQHQASLSFTISRNLLKLMSTESMMPSNHLVFVVSFSSCLQSFSASEFFSNELTLRSRWPKYWSFSFSISPSNEYSGLISFRNDWIDLLAVPGTLKSLLQHHTGD